MNLGEPDCNDIMTCAKTAVLSLPRMSFAALSSPAYIHGDVCCLVERLSDGISPKVYACYGTMVRMPCFIDYGWPLHPNGGRAIFWNRLINGSA